MINTRMRTWLLLSLLLGSASYSAHAEYRTLPCASMKELKLRKATITVADLVEKGSFEAPDGKVYQVPSFCRIHGVLKPTPDSEINFELWMPTSKWTGRYYQHGEGASGGIINYGALAAMVSAGNAVAATDDGHVKPPDLGSSWVLRGSQVLIDFGYRALKETTDHARVIVRTFYGGPSDYNYFVGCSDGGRQALMAAQRYPEDWDGILAGAPGFARVAFSGGSTAAVGQVWVRNREGRIPPSKLTTIQRGALASCTAEAHVVGGIAGDPRHCQFNPASLVCSGPESDECLTVPQIDTLRSLYGGVLDPQTGEQIYPGWPSTSEADSNWSFQITGGGDWRALWSKAPSQEPGWLERARQFYRYYVYEDPKWDFAKLDLHGDLQYAYHKRVSGQSLSSVLDAVDVDLGALRNWGGKLIIYHGWADSGITPLGSIDYFEAVARKVGSIEATRDFFRLYLVPGMEHCVGRAEGTNAFGQMPGYSPPVPDDPNHNILRALERWVEHGQTPYRLIATKFREHDPRNGVEMTRPLCAYPEVAVYQGSGNIADAANFRCEAGAPVPERPNFLRR